jgi:L-2,4-diaminobutyrate decarboxylase
MKDINDIKKNPDREMFKKSFGSDEFSIRGSQIVNLLTKYLRDLEEGHIKEVLPYFTPKEILKNWPGDFPDKGSKNLVNTLSRVIKESNHLHHPLYAGHQCTPSLPLAALIELISDFLNNGTAVFEMGPVNVAMEKRLIDWMAGQIGYSNNADGVFTSGGTLGNLTALLAARQTRAGYNIWSEGVKNNLPLYILAAEDSHYSIKRAAGIMGLGENALIPVKVCENYKMDIKDLKIQAKAVRDKGAGIMAVVAKACSTATGTHDPLNEIGNFCNRENIWFHVDAAHGGSALLSNKYKQLLKGIQKADSVVWDAHKMLLMPALTTAVIFKEKTHSYEAFSQNASYLFEKDPRKEWYNYAHRTMECTKKMIGLKLYVSLQVMGIDFFRNYIDYTYDLTREFALLIKNTPDFELGAEPESNIICFRYMPENSKNQDIDLLQSKIRKKLLKRGDIYIVQTILRERLYLRCTLINPLTGSSDLHKIIEVIRSTGKKISKN